MLGGEGGGGNNRNSIFPGFAEENCIQYSGNTLPRLQLFANVPIQCGAGIETINHNGNRTVLADDHPIDRGTVLNLNPLSTGLKLSCEEDEHNSSLTSARENMKNNGSVMLSLGNTVKMEINRQLEEFGRCIRIQEENILKGVREINQRHMISLLNAVEKGVSKKLQEKQLEIETMNRKNKELGDRMKQVAAEAHSWHYRAKYNESVVNVLRNNIQQLMEQCTGQALEGSGDSELDDAMSCSDHQKINSGSGSRGTHKLPPKCRACYGKEVSILILPCRHLCLCVDCEGFVNVCPVCQVMKTASVHVCM